VSKLILFLFASLVLSITVSATNLRGEIMRQGNSGPFPLANTRVDLMIWNGQQWIDASFAITGADGFYYFVNFSPGTLFFIKVFERFYPPQPLTILNILPPYYQDLPIIYT